MQKRDYPIMADSPPRLWREHSPLITGRSLAATHLHARGENAMSRLWNVICFTTHLHLCGENTPAGHFVCAPDSPPPAWREQAICNQLNLHTRLTSTHVERTFRAACDLAGCGESPPRTWREPVARPGLPGRGLNHIHLCGENCVHLHSTWFSPPNHLHLRGENATRL